MAGYEHTFDLPGPMHGAFDAGEFLYRADARDFYFTGSSIAATITLSKYAIGIRGDGFIVTGENPAWGLEVKETHVVRNGNPIRSRDSVGYRRDIISDLANSGISISDEVLDGVFWPIENDLVQLYRSVFPLAAVPVRSEPPGSRTLEGTVTHIFSTGQVGESVRNVYEMRNEEGTHLFAVYMSPRMIQINEGSRVSVEILPDVPFGTFSDEITSFIPEENRTYIIPSPEKTIHRVRSYSVREEK